VSARYDDMLLLAGLYDDVADDLRTSSATLARLVADMATDPHTVIAAVLSPGTAGTAAASLADGAATLLPLALGSDARAAFLRSAVVAYRTADQAMEQATQSLQDLTGRALGAAAPGLGLAGAAWWFGTGAGADAAGALGWTAGEQAVDRARAGSLSAAQQLLLDHPGVAEHVIGGAAGLQQGLLSWLPPGARPLLGRRGYPATYEDAVGSLALFFRDGDPVLGQGGARQPGDERAPADVTDLLLGVNRRQNRVAGGARPGEIGVVRLRAPDGTVRWVVQLPGTEAWPLQSGALARDTSTNLHTMAGASTVYMRGVADALREAGAAGGGDVLLVGHSQGGMTAAALAADDAFRAEFDVTHVVTAGSPIARADVPSDVQVLAVENRYDLVPRLDGRSNDDRGHITTVVFDRQDDDVGRNHGLLGYADAVSRVDQADPSYAAWLSSAGGFLDPGNAAHPVHRTISRAEP
jgi:hypothetical protein